MSNVRARADTLMVVGRTKPAVVDSHHHLWDLDRGHYPWLSASSPPEGLLGDIAPLQHSYSIDDYLADMDELEILQSVHVQAEWDPADPVGETQWLERTHRHVAIPTAFVVGCRLENDNAADVLAGHSAYAQVRGVRQLLNWHETSALRSTDRPDHMTDPTWRRGFAQLETFGFSFDLQIYPRQMPVAARLASDFPGTLFVLNHCGMPIRAPGESRHVWSRGLDLLAGCENVTVKLSGLGVFSRHWSIDDVRGMVHALLGHFGSRRVMVGSNYPVDKLHSGLNPLVVLAHLAQELSADERDDLLCRTARRVYRLPEPTYEFVAQ